MNLNRSVLGTLGLIIGFALYWGAGRLAEPWSNVAIGACFVALGGLAFWYAAGERWIQVLGAVLALYGLLRATVLN